MNSDYVRSVNWLKSYLIIVFIDNFDNDIVIIRFKPVKGLTKWFRRDPSEPREARWDAIQNMNDLMHVNVSERNIVKDNDKDHVLSKDTIS